MKNWTPSSLTSMHSSVNHPGSLGEYSYFSRPSVLLTKQISWFRFSSTPFAVECLLLNSISVAAILGVVVVCLSL
ncbi:hypothetical protein L208DRAFT_476668 [Tricholoma matsutake]|nr:hypothetical protein L208DRAFT_476668 [Tricholoma matsutake 945]